MQVYAKAEVGFDEGLRNHVSLQTEHDGLQNRYKNAGIGREYVVPG